MSESLSNLGSDLSFTISFSISRELLDAAADAGISQEELVAIVLGVGVVFTALPKTLGVLWKELWPPSPGDKDEEESRGSLVEFIGILASLVKRISASVSVQLLAATVVSKQPLRSVRITLLLGVRPQRFPAPASALTLHCARAGRCLLPLPLGIVKFRKAARGAEIARVGAVYVCVCVSLQAGKKVCGGAGSQSYREITLRFSTPL